MKLKQQAIATGLALFLLAGAGVWAFAAQNASGSPSNSGTGEASGATGTPKATEPAGPAESPTGETNEPTAVETPAPPEGTPDAGCNVENDGAHNDNNASGATPAAPDPCDVQQEGEHQDGDGDHDGPNAQ